VKAKSESLSISINVPPMRASIYSATLMLDPGRNHTIKREERMQV
jgi:hypothetical protein